MRKAVSVSGFLLAFLLSGNFAAGPEQQSQPVPGKPRTVPFVDLSRYTGTWFEIAKIPNRFQKKCARDTTAQYRIKPDGRIEVINRCVDKSGKLIETRGIARIAEPQTNSKLKVSFVRALGIQLFWGDYWIIGLHEDYRYAVVGDSKRKYGWILARSPALSEPEWIEVRDILKRQGYDPERFIPTEHIIRK